MKPILLKLSGLQSYREPQEIDFETLCETGLFGIFGPTGAGNPHCWMLCFSHVRKGGVRLTEPVNHSEDSLSVSFV